MLAMTSLIVEKCVSSICFLTFYILQKAPLKRCEAWGNFPLLFLLTGFGALITR